MYVCMFQWAEQSVCWYLEAKWYHSGYVPTTEEYLKTAWISITGPLLLFYGYLTTTNPINKQELQSLEQRPGVIHWPSMVLRLADDLGTSSVSLLNYITLQCTCIFSHFFLFYIHYYYCTGRDPERGCSQINSVLHGRNRVL